MTSDKKKITVEAHGGTYSFEGEYITVDDWVEVFEKVLYNVGFHTETIKEVFEKE